MHDTDSTARGFPRWGGPHANGALFCFAVVHVSHLGSPAFAHVVAWCEIQLCNQDILSFVSSLDMRLAWRWVED